MDFSEALEALKKGKRVTRKGWNGKGMWLFLYTPTEKGVLYNKEYECSPYVVMKTADDKLVPWLASQTDILAEDWEAKDWEIVD